jgi:transposase
MRLQEYGRNPHKRKEYGHHPDLLLVGVDVSKATHRACLGTQTTMSGRKLAFTHTREGFRRFAQTRKAHLDKNGRPRGLLAMAPSGLDWQALYERLKSCGYAVCLVHCQAVRNHRKTMQDGTSQTDEKDAASLFDFRRRASSFCPLPVIRHARPPPA